MLIVLEGCDGTGKTTLANKLAMMLGAEIIHCTTNTPNTHWFFHDIIEAAVTRNIIADRFCYGQFVYQNPEERQLSKEDLYNLETHMLNMGARVLYVDCDESTIKNRLKRRAEVTTKPIREIRLAYEELLSNSILPVINIDTSRPELGISKYLKER